MANNTDLTNKPLTADKPLFAAAADAAVVTLCYLTFQLVTIYIYIFKLQ